MGIDSDLIRGHIDTIILKILFDGDKYGYEICKEVEERSNGTYELKQPTLYSCLKRLEDKGFISSYWEDSDIGGKRHYYKLTDSGKEEYNKNQQEWIKSRSIIDELISDAPKSAPETNVQTIEQISPSSLTNDLSTDSTDEQEVDMSEIMLDTDTDSAPFDIDNNTEITDNNSLLEDDTINDSPIEEDFVNEPEPEIETDDNYDIMSLLGHMPPEENSIEEDLSELESAQSILNSFDLKYNNISENEESESSSELEDSDQMHKGFSSVENLEPQIEDSKPLTEEVEETFNFNEYLDNQDSYFESEEAKSPIKNYITPNIVIDGRENVEPEPEINTTQNFFEPPVVDEIEETQEDDPLSYMTPSYINFDDQGNAHEINNTSYDDEIYVDDSNINYDEIYINPEETSQENTLISDEEDSEIQTFTNVEPTTSFTSFDIDSQEDEEIEVEETTELKPTTFANSAVTEPFEETFTPKYTDEEYKQMLNQLDSVKDNTTFTNEDRKIQMFTTDSFNKNITKDYSELRNSLADEGFTVRPHLHQVKESQETKNYIQSNKIKLVQSWITFGFITCFLAIMYLALANSASPDFLYGFHFKYFLIGMAVTLILPAIHTIIYIFNPHKKHLAKFLPRASYIISILLAVQLLILVYCVNLQLGFYSFSQEHYNHLLWIIPSIMSMYPIIQTIIYHMLYNSKRFHI